MDYLKRYNLSESEIEDIKNSNEDIIYNKLYMYETTVKKNLDFLLSLGFNNIYDLLKYKLMVVFEYNNKLKSKINVENISLINEDIYYLEFLGY